MNLYTVTYKNYNNYNYPMINIVARTTAQAVEEANAWLDKKYWKGHGNPITKVELDREIHRVRK